MRSPDIEDRPFHRARQFDLGVVDAQPLANGSNTHAMRLMMTLVAPF